jgi:hypothetical protein
MTDTLAPPDAADRSQARDTASIQLGLVVSPALDEPLALELRDELHRLLSERYASVDWDIALLRDPLVTPPVDLTDLVDAARRRLLDEDWDLAVVVTELPLRHGRRPLLSHASRMHGVGLVSLPAVGVVQRRRRLRDAAADTVGALIGDPLHKRAKGRALARRLAELATDLDDDPSPQGVVFLARVISGNIRLLLGMIGANHPWRLVGRLSKALLGTLAVVVFALVTSDVWRLATSLDGLRLTVLMLLSTAAVVATLIVAHHLWERAPDRRAREQVMLFNLATLATVVFGVLTLYAFVFAVCLGAAALLIDSSVFARQVGHRVDATDYLALAWLASSLATAGGALGAMVESDEAVREAAYAYRPEDAG